MEYFLIIIGVVFIIIAAISMFLHKKNSIAKQKEYEARQRALKEYEERSKAKTSTVVHKAAETRRTTPNPSRNIHRSNPRQHTSRCNCTDNDGPDVLTTMLVADAILDSGSSSSNFSSGGGSFGGGGSSGGWSSSDCGGGSCDCGGGGCD